MEAHDSLPYIDSDISPAQRTAANALISRELHPNHVSTLHPNLTPLANSSLTPLLQQEVTRVGAGKPLVGGIDLARYESSDEISPDTNIEVFKTVLRTVYTNTTYLRNRQANITLLEDHGKNAWLIGNSHLDDIQKRLEAELATTKKQSENINRMRRAAQEDSKGELLALEDTWKLGIGNIIDTQIATDALRQPASFQPSTIPADA